MTGCLLDGLHRRCINESAVFQLIFFGRYVEGGQKPRYLRAELYDQMKQNIGKIRVLNDDFLSYMNTFSSSHKVKISLSNVPTFMNYQERSGLWTLVSDRVP